MVVFMGPSWKRCRERVFVFGRVTFPTFPHGFTCNDSFMRVLLSLPLIVLPLGAAPTDEELLALVKERTKLERVTPVPVDLPPPLELPCRIGNEVTSPHEVRGPDPSGLGSFEIASGGSRFHVFANDSAVLPIFDPWGKFPEGSLIVKEKTSCDDGRTRGFTAMLKREKGYFPECGDWEFFTVDGAATKIVERGKLARCSSCHEDFQGDFASKNYVKPAQLSGGRIVLHASKAQVQGKKLQYEPLEEKNTLGFWVDAEDHASWSFDVTRPGRYEVHVWQGCGKDSGGSEVEISAGDQRTRFTVEDTGHFQNFKERTVGTLAFKQTGPQKLEVHALSKAGVAVMDLRQVVLVPVP